MDVFVVGYCTRVLLKCEFICTTKCWMFCCYCTIIAFLMYFFLWNNNSLIYLLYLCVLEHQQHLIELMNDTLSWILNICYISALFSLFSLEIWWFKELNLIQHFTRQSFYMEIQKLESLRWSKLKQWANSAFIWWVQISNNTNTSINNDQKLQQLIFAKIQSYSRN
jgi:hypothetical protein